MRISFCSPLGVLALTVVVGLLCLCLVASSKILISEERELVTVLAGVGSVAVCGVELTGRCFRQTKIYDQ